MALPAYVVLITGPPCSGKTTYARQHHEPGDLILDLDDIARELGSPTPWLHPHPYGEQAEQRMRATMNKLPGTGSGTAWVIRTAPTPQARALITKLIHAHASLVMNPGRDICIDRARTDNRPAATISHIHDWYARYKPWSRDTTITHWLADADA